VFEHSSAAVSFLKPLCAAAKIIGTFATLLGWLVFVVLIVLVFAVVVVRLIRWLFAYTFSITFHKKIIRAALCVTYP